MDVKKPPAVTIDLVTGSDAQSPTSATFKVTSAVQVPTGISMFALIADLSAVGTNGTLDALVEHSDDQTDWYELIRFAQVTAATAVTQSCSRQANTAGTVTAAIGKNNTTTMTIGSAVIIGPPTFRYWRLRYIAGAGTNAAATQRVRAMFCQ